MAVRHKKSDLHSLQMARELIRHNARSCVVEYQTGISKTLAHEIARSIGGDRRGAGPLPSDMTTWLNRRSHYRIPVVIFINALARELGDDLYSAKKLETQSLLNAFEAYLTITGPHARHRLPICLCWQLAREIQYQLDMQLKPCRCCGSLYPWTISDNPDICWICEDVASKTGIRPTLRNNAEALHKTKTL